MQSHIRVNNVATQHPSQDGAALPCRGRRSRGPVDRPGLQLVVQQGDLDASGSQIRRFERIDQWSGLYSSFMRWTASGVSTRVVRQGSGGMTPTRPFGGDCQGGRMLAEEGGMATDRYGP